MNWLRGAVLDFRHDPFLAADALAVLDDGMVGIDQGRIAWVGPAAEARPAAGEAVAHHRDCLIAPGFIDTHVHYPQLGMVAAYGAQLLDWLERYTFPAEARFADPAHAAGVASAFLDQLLAAGVTTACVYCTVHPASVDAFFAESERRNTRMVAGKVLMDRHAPPALLDTAASGAEQSRALIARWHGRGRQLYAITPRFAPACSPAQLEGAGRLWAEHPGTLMQTHLAESPAECAWVRELFPGAADYLDVYHRFGLTGRGAVFGHGLHLSEAEFCRCHATGSAIAHCPSSNFFLGSGTFRLTEAKRRDRPVCVGLGSDIGAGTSLSPLRTLGEAYKAAALNGGRLTGAQGFWLATRGGAEALGLERLVGRIAVGMEADLVVLDPCATPILAQRMQGAANWEERLFALMSLGDERAVREVRIMGQTPASI